MTDTVRTYWDDVADAVADGVSIAWDGCHKIYVQMDEEQHNTVIGYGYDPIRITDADEAMQLLRGWYESSCGLRFITKVSTVEGDPNDGYESLIPQFAD